MLRELLVILIASLTMWYFLGYWFVITIHAITVPVYVLWQGLLVYASGVTPLRYTEAMLIIFMGIGMSHLISYLESIMYTDDYQ